jgi:hypothetical protein
MYNVCFHHRSSPGVIRPANVRPPDKTVVNQHGHVDFSVLPRLMLVELRVWHGRSR